MEQHIIITDSAFESQFENCTIDPAIFSHEAHLRLACIHVKKYGVEQAVQNVCTQLMEFVNFVGAKDKYNQTLTVAAVKAVAHFVNKSDCSSFAEFIAAFPRLKYNFKELMCAHYSVDIFQSEKAKKEFLLPDLLPFD